MYIGNIDKSVEEEELKNIFYKKYSSIIRLRLIKDNETNESKGYGFIEFNDFNEFTNALNNKYPVILGKQKLVFKSAKNKCDKSFFPNQKQKDKFDLFFGPKMDNNIFHKNDTFFPNYFNENKENLNIRNYISINNLNLINRPFIEKQNKFEINNNIETKIEKKNEIENMTLNEQIKYSLQNIAKQYSQNENFMNSKICNYYCAPFLDKNNFCINK